MALEKTTENQEIIQFCTFRLRSQLFGVNILEVKEIDRLMPFTPVHHAPSEVKGLVNIRGQIYLILDLSALLEEEAQEVKPENRLLIFKESIGESFGILVDRIGDVIDVASKQITTYAESSSDKIVAKAGSFKTGVCQLKDELMVVISAAKILEFVHTKMNGHAAV
ncbi:MAG: purine-binding chemotaxis protein CheW [Acidobacteria bacterium]|nr:purine-binding chemotaxis protein CheW [Acidobacteriota bacterium]MCB9399386.1 purine-binding chemotaxis protein CheW [Acidobacteriota bacterium]